MKLSVTKCGVVLAILSSGGFTWRATSSVDGIGIGAAVHSLHQTAVMGAETESVVFLPEPLAAVKVTSPARTLPVQKRLILPFEFGSTNADLTLPPPPNLVFDRPPAPSVGLLSARQESVAAGLAPDMTDELAQPEPVSEAEARVAVLDMFGGEVAQFAGESDMAQAYAAAKQALRAQGVALSAVDMLAIIDFTLPSFDRRLAIYNPRTGEESRHLVAHGHHTGELYADSFSNVPRSLQSSPGLYRIGNHYDGEHGRAIRLHGLQPNVNDRAFARDVVIHAAWYVSYKTILENQRELGVPRIGRSHGCPAVSTEDLPVVLEKLQPGSYLFIYPVPGYVPSMPAGVERLEQQLR